MSSSIRPGTGSGMRKRTESELHDRFSFASNDPMATGGRTFRATAQPSGECTKYAAGVLAVTGWGLQCLVSAARLASRNRLSRISLSGDDYACHFVHRDFCHDLGHRGPQSRISPGRAGRPCLTDEHRVGPGTRRHDSGLVPRGALSPACSSCRHSSDRLVSVSWYSGDGACVVCAHQLGTDHRLADAIDSRIPRDHEPDSHADLVSLRGLLSRLWVALLAWLAHAVESVDVCH